MKLNLQDRELGLREAPLKQYLNSSYMQAGARLLHVYRKQRGALEAGEKERT